jgi:hypothetical protein
LLTLLGLDLLLGSEPVFDVVTVLVASRYVLIVGSISDRTCAIEILIFDGVLRRRIGIELRVGENDRVLLVVIV